MFNIFDESTWIHATEKEFSWNGKSLPVNAALNGKSELEVANFIGGIIKAVYEADEFKPGVLSIGKKAAITLLLEKLFCGISMERIYSELFEYLRKAGKKKTFFHLFFDDIKPITVIQPKIYSMVKSIILDKSTEDNKFEILDIDTWDNATQRPFLWNNKTLPDKDGNPLTEYDIMNLFRSIFAFLERNGDIVPLEKKIDAIKRKLDGMEKVQEDPEYYSRQKAEKEAEDDKKMPDGLFNPRDPKTYQFTKHKPLIIDDIEIFSVSATGIREPESEKEFVSKLEALKNIYYKEMIWGEAVKIAKTEFQSSNEKDPDDKTPGYMTRINEVYKSILQNPAGRLTKKQEKNYIDDYIQRKLDECKPREKWLHGGYEFSEAQMEIVDGLPEDTITRIGEIVSIGKSEGKRSYQIKQDLFPLIGSVGEFLLALHNSSYTKFEEDIMNDYFSGFEDFKDDQEINNFFNSNNYLKKHQDLKNKLIENAMNLLHYDDNE